MFPLRSLRWQCGGCLVPPPPAAARLHCCYEDWPHGNMKTRRHGDTETWRPPEPVPTSTMAGCWTGLAWYRGCMMYYCGPPPCSAAGWRWSQEWGTALACPHWPRHTPPHFNLSKHCVLHRASTLHCHNHTSAQQAAEVIVLSHCTTVWIWSVSQTYLHWKTLVISFILGIPFIVGKSIKVSMRTKNIW